MWLINMTSWYSYSHVKKYCSQSSNFEEYGKNSQELVKKFVEKFHSSSILSMAKSNGCEYNYRQILTHIKHHQRHRKTPNKMQSIITLRKNID